MSNLQAVQGKQESTRAKYLASQQKTESSKANFELFSLSMDSQSTQSDFALRNHQTASNRVTDFNTTLSNVEQMIDETNSNAKNLASNVLQSNSVVAGLSRQLKGADNRINDLKNKLSNVQANYNKALGGFDSKIDQLKEVPMLNEDGTPALDANGNPRFQDNSELIAKIQQQKDEYITQHKEHMNTQIAKIKNQLGELFEKKAEIQEKFNTAMSENSNLVELADKTEVKLQANIASKVVIESKIAEAKKEATSTEAKYHLELAKEEPIKSQMVSALAIFQRDEAKTEQIKRQLESLEAQSLQNQEKQKGLNLSA